MTILSADRETARKETGLKAFPAGTDVLYKGGFALMNEAGYAVAAPVAASCAGFKFAGVSSENVDNSAGSPGDLSVKVYTSGLFLFDAVSISQAMVGQMMYLVDDCTFDDVPGAYSIPVGILQEYVSATSGWIRIDAAVDYPNSVKSDFVDFVLKTDNYTCTAKDSGKVFSIATDAKKFTLPATAKGLKYTFVNTGADGGNILQVDPAATDGISGGGLATGVVNKDLINTKATAKQFDYITIVGTGNAGAGAWVITGKQGVWAAEA